MLLITKFHLLAFKSLRSNLEFVLLLTAVHLPETSRPRIIYFCLLLVMILRLLEAGLLTSPNEVQC
jgi:hypothetical protein